MPLAGQFSPSESEARSAARYPLTWVECRRCSLVQVLEDIPDAVLFGQYRYGSSTISGMVRHFEDYARFLTDRFGRGSVRVAEIGANDGVLLSRLPASWDLVGVDPSDVAREQKSGDYDLLNVPFTVDLALTHPDRGQFDLVTSSNAMAHFTDLHGAIEAAHILLKRGGELILEVHDLDATLAGAQWDTIYHEHKVEWSEASLRTCVTPLGFEPTFTQRLALHGGLLRCGFRSVAPHRSAAASPGLDDARFKTLVTSYSNRCSSPAYIGVQSVLERGGRVVAYGASGRANVWINQMPKLRFEYLVDDSPLRIGRWLPCASIPILESKALDRDDPAACLITAWNYAADIQAKHPSFSGTWLKTFDL